MGSPDPQLPDTTLFLTVFASKFPNQIKNLQAGISTLREFVKPVFRPYGVRGLNWQNAHSKRVTTSHSVRTSNPLKPPRLLLKPLLGVLHVGHQTTDQMAASSTPAETVLYNNLRQVVHIL